jgi:hypothetical protein
MYPGSTPSRSIPGQDRITDFADGLETIAFNTALVDSFADLAIAGNGTSEVTVSYAGNTIIVQGTGPITLSAADFSFI